MTGELEREYLRMKSRETAAQRKDRFNRTICQCGHSMAWHFGKITHIGQCTYPGCRCDSYRHQHD